MNERIKELRDALNLTQQDFADKLGTSRGNIAGYETGRRSPSDAVVSLICNKFNVNEEWLRSGSGEMFKERLPGDEVAAYVEDLLDHKPEENPFYDMIVGMMKTYRDLDEPSRKAALRFFRQLRENLEEKKEG